MCAAMCEQAHVWGAHVRVATPEEKSLSLRLFARPPWQTFSASSLSTVTASLLAGERPMQGKTNLTWNLACNLNQAFFFIYVNVGRERLIAGYLKLEQWQSSSRGNKTNGVNESTLYCLCKPWKLVRASTKQLICFSFSWTLTHEYALHGILAASI